jgi:hypothetical protein
VGSDLEGGMRWGATWKEGLLSSQRYELGRVQSHGCAQLKLILLAVGGGWVLAERALCRTLSFALCRPTAHAFSSAYAVVAAAAPGGNYNAGA